MNAQKNPVKKFYIPLISLLVIAAGCLSSNVKLRQDTYIPSFNAEEFSEYKGKSIYLPSFVNRAENTTVWYYYSLDKKRKYLMNNLEQFFWNCFQDAFLHVGIFVYESGYPGQGVSVEDRLKEGLKEFRLQFSSMTDTEYRFIVTLCDRGSIVFQRKFIIPMDLPEIEDNAALEQRAFKMIDKSIRTILKDPDFKEAFFTEFSPDPGTQKGEQI
ncbi:MAG TPA: hypothetical protein PK926_05875 [Spirochaetota bacterium]|nr:hypothetical protein [Spirochaetota bacterium]HPI87708.1 hypothetical protein [Spirochaetota bacterium]HPR48167.1 hypothetical protein [Spirochaetota bacterium]